MLKIMLKNFFGNECCESVHVQFKFNACCTAVRDDSKQSCRVLSCCSLNEAFNKENTHSEAAEDG